MMLITDASAIKQFRMLFSLYSHSVHQFMFGPDSFSLALTLYSYSVLYYLFIIIQIQYIFWMRHQMGKHNVIFSHLVYLFPLMILVIHIDIELMIRYT